MRIRKKAPKPSARRPPLYFIGYRGSSPTIDEMTVWYEREYGGPLMLRAEAGAPEAWQACHGPWSAHVVMPLPPSHAADIMKHLAWEHDLMGAVAPSIASPRDMPDTILFAARLARGLTLLTQGTAYDVAIQTYLNPSDWHNRLLTAFRSEDHIAIMQTESPDGRDWFYTVGLSKFGLDELELFRPHGLSSTGPTGALTGIAEELTRTGQVPKVGASLTVPSLQQPIQVVRHRTASPGGKQLILREVEID